MPLWAIINMNIGFFGIQYSFGLQQTNMTPIYSFLGANPDEIPWLNLAGPMTGLIVQPIVGAMSDSTTSRFGRRRPYFVVGAILCSICLLLMPFSSTLWMAAGLLWILDAANNITMEPYRAFVSDKLPPEQYSTGFLSQSFFTGLGITLANLTPGLLVALGIIGLNSRAGNGITYTTYVAFMIGAVVSIVSVMYSVITTKEDPLSDEEKMKIKSQPKGILHVFHEIKEAIREMPRPMRQLGWVYLFNWYAMFIYWQFITLCLASTIFHTSDPKSEAFSNAQLLTGTVNGTYNIATLCSAFLLVMVVKKIGSRQTHSACLALAGIGLLMVPLVHNSTWVLLPIVGFGIGWASMMGTPYVILAGSIPQHRTGVYMGILNMFIVLPMLLETVSFSAVYKGLLHSNPVNAIRFAGILILVAAFLTTRISKGAHETKPAIQHV